METENASQSTRTKYLGSAENADLVNVANFSNILVDSIIEGFRAAANCGGTRGFLLHSRLRSRNIDPGKFHADLYSLLGTASEIVEKSIVRQLFQRLGLPFRDDEFNFESSLKLAMIVYRTRAKEVDLV